MSKFFILALCFFLAILLETAIINLPLVLLLLLITTIFFRTEWVFVLGFFLGIIIDGLTFRHLGETSLFFILFLFCVFLYDQKFELKTPTFAILMSTIGGLFYYLIFGSQILIVQVLTTTIIGVLLFLAFNLIYNNQTKKASGYLHV